MNTIKFKNFYVRSSLFTILSLTTAVFSYILYPILVRVLNPVEFGDFAVVIAILNQILAVLVAINVISIYLVKTYGEQEARDRAQIIQKALIWFFVALSLVVLLLSPFLNQLFKIEDFGLFVVMTTILLTTLPLVVWTGYLQGHKELVRIGVSSVVGAFSKLVFAVILAIFFGPIGALAGVLLGSIVSIIAIGKYPGVKLPNLSSIFKKGNKDELKFLSNIRLYMIEAVFIVGALGLLQNYDITLAKALFGPSVAGIYSGVSILSNSLYYLAFILVWIVLPEIKIGDNKVNRRVLGTAYKLIGALAVFVVTVELVFKDSLTSLLLGHGFADQGNLLIFATLYQLTLVSIVLYAFYLLVCRKNRGVLLVGLVFAFCMSMPVLLGKTPMLMIQTLWLSLVASVVVYFILLRTYYFIKK